MAMRRNVTNRLVSLASAFLFLFDFTLAATSAPCDRQRYVHLAAILPPKSCNKVSNLITGIGIGDDDVGTEEVVQRLITSRVMTKPRSCKFEASPQQTWSNDHSGQILMTYPPGFPKSTTTSPCTRLDRTHRPSPGISRTIISSSTKVRAHPGHEKRDARISPVDPTKRPEVESSTGPTDQLSWSDITKVVSLHTPLPVIKNSVRSGFDPDNNVPPSSSIPVKAESATELPPEFKSSATPRFTMPPRPTSRTTTPMTLVVSTKQPQAKTSALSDAGQRATRQETANYSLTSPESSAPPKPSYRGSHSPIATEHPGSTAVLACDIASKIPEGTMVAVNGTAIDLLPIPLATLPCSPTSALVMTIGSITYKFNAAGEFVVGTQTLGPGNAITIDDTVISEIPSVVKIAHGSNSHESTPEATVRVQTTDVVRGGGTGSVDGAASSSASDSSSFIMFALIMMFALL